MTPTTSLRIDGVSAHDSSAARRAAAPPAALALSALLALPFLSAGAQGLLACVAGVMALTAIHGWRARRQGDVRGALEVSDEGLVLDAGGRRAELSWSGVTRWSVDDARDVVTLERDDGATWTLSLPDDDAVSAVVGPLRRAFERRALTVALRGSLGAGGWTALVVLLTLGAPIPLADAVSRVAGPLAGLVTWLVGLAVAARVAREVCRSRVTVGDDGLSLQHLGCERFIPWEHVSDLDWDELGVMVRLIDGEELPLPLLSASMVRDARDASVERAIKLRDALHERLRAGLDGFGRRRDEGDAMESLLDRRGRTLDDWREAVRRLVDRIDGYRGVRLDPVLAARVLDDPSAPIERRVAAVWALTDHDGARASTRVRVAVDAVACEPVREALARAADDYLDEDTLERAEEFAGR